MKAFETQEEQLGDTEYGELEVVTDDFDVNGTISSEGVEYTEDGEAPMEIEITEKTTQK